MKLPPSTDNQVSPAPGLMSLRRIINRLALALLALGVGAFAQSLLSEDTLWDGLFLYLLAMGLFIRAVGHIELRKAYWVTPFRGLFAGLGLRHSGWQIFGTFYKLFSIHTPNKENIYFYFPIIMRCLNNYNQKDLYFKGW